VCSQKSRWLRGLYYCPTQFFFQEQEFAENPEKTVKIAKIKKDFVKIWKILQIFENFRKFAAIYEN